MVQAHLTGTFPRSEELIASTRAFERGRLAQVELDRQFAGEAARVVALQVEARLDYVTDGLLQWQDLLRPLSDEIAGLHAGPVTRWFDNNTFYRRPVVAGRIRPTGEAVLRWTARDALKGRPWKAILPSPWAFLRLAEDQVYQDDDALLADITEVVRAEAAALVAAGCQYVQFSDPVLVGRPEEGAVERARRALARVTDGLAVTTALHTFFGDVSPVIAALLDFPVDEIGFDLFATDLEQLNARVGRKALLVGALDGRNSLLEDARETADIVLRVADRLGASRVAVVPSCALDFLPWEVAAGKVRRLGEIRTLLEGEA